MWPPNLRRLFPPANERQRVAHLDQAETLEKSHGRIVRHRLEATTRLAGHADWPGLQQVCRLTRTTLRKGQKKVEVAYAISSVPRSQAGAAQLLTWWRDHWDIENRSHYVRDVTLQEDACQIHSGHAPQIFAALRNACISFLRLHGCTNLAAGFRDCAWNPQRLLTKLGIFKH
jgi:predicted transposase YbfD/YdcC